MKYELNPRYIKQKSFYGKAWVIENGDGSKALQSYKTIVSKCSPDGKVEHLGKYSRTTTRHQKEFELQFGK